MKVLVCGDRNWTNRQLIERELRRFDPKTTIIIHGAARGADTIAGEIATSLGFQVMPFPADWDRLGRAAGPIRNREMLKQQPDRVLAFHNNLDKSKGTADMVSIARRALVPVEVFQETGANPSGA